MPPVTLCTWDAGSDLGGQCYLILHHVLWGVEEKREPATFLRTRAKKRTGVHLQREPFVG